MSEKTLAESEQVFALAAAQRLEVLELSARIERLHAVLREHGISPPETDPALGASDGEHLQACVAVVSAAYDLLERLEELRKIVGSGMELVKPWC